MSAAGSLSESGNPSNYGTSLRSSSGDTSIRTTVSIVPEIESESQTKERVWVVAWCALVACLASLVGGMNGAFTSPALLELQNYNRTTSSAQYFDNSSKLLPNLFGVRKFCASNIEHCESINGGHFGAQLI